MIAGKPPVIANEPPVIASEAKQSRVRAFPRWIASPFGFAMTTLSRDCGQASRHCERAPRHCERSKAIQGEGIPPLDCFTLRVRNDNPLSA
ncbi:MAG: hypothetical protein LBT00_05100 [Spirochaetaceae bacterium]|nr:hypothetical protein [Spirochaetaceae bacterium]